MLWYQDFKLWRCSGFMSSCKVVIVSSLPKSPKNVNKKFLGTKSEENLRLTVEQDLLDLQKHKTSALLVRLHS